MWSIDDERGIRCYPEVNFNRIAGTKGVMVMSEERTRLEGLIEHWAHHNDEHMDRFSESAERAKGLGSQGAADELRLAAERSGEVSAHLRNALKLLRGE